MFCTLQTQRGYIIFKAYPDSFFEEPAKIFGRITAYLAHVFQRDWRAEVFVYITKHLRDTVAFVYIVAF